MQLSLTDQQLKDIVVEALFEKIDPDERKRMITTALQALMAPTDGNYGRKLPSRLQSAMEGALLKVAQGILDEEVSRPETQELVRSMAREAFEKVATDRPQIVQRMAAALSAALVRSDER